MEYTELGRTGLRVSRIGLGAWQFTEAWGLTEYSLARDIIRRAIENGVNFFDTAMVYGLGMSEVFLGKALRDTGVKRDDVVISTKIPGQFLNPSDIYKSIERSLSNLGFSYVDVLLAHWPPCWHNFPTCEYARALERLIELGKVNYLGLSDYPVELVEAFRQCLAKHDIQVLQIRYNLVERYAEKQHIPYAERHGLSIQAWSPIAKGALTGKYELGSLEFKDLRSQEPIFHPDNYSKVWKLVELLRKIGEKYGRKPVQVALNWLIMSSSVIIPIPGAKKPEQVDDLAAAIGWRLSYSDWRLLEEKSRSIEINYSIFYLQNEVNI